MTDAPSNVVPFGKYRGQPVEVMLADRAYCEWAMAQPGIRERYPTFVTIVINGGSAPDAPTPEHNRMQLLFRDPAMRVAAYRAIVGEAIVTPAIAEAIHNSDVEFEVNGWDVVLRPRWRWDLDVPKLSIELKPQLGDDYPAVLRAMKMRNADGRRVLIVDRFEAESASLDDVKWLFAQSGIEVRTLAEICAALPSAKP